MQVAIYEGITQARRVESGHKVQVARPVLGLPAGSVGMVTQCPVFDLEGRFQVDFAGQPVTFNRLNYTALVHADGVKLWPPVGTRR